MTKQNIWDAERPATGAEIHAFVKALSKSATSKLVQAISRPDNLESYDTGTIDRVFENLLDFSPAEIRQIHGIAFKDERFRSLLTGSFIAAAPETKVDPDIFLKWGEAFGVDIDTITEARKDLIEKSQDEEWTAQHTLKPRQASFGTDATKKITSELLAAHKAAQAQLKL